MFLQSLPPLPFTVAVEPPTFAEVLRCLRRPWFWLFLLVATSAGAGFLVVRQRLDARRVSEAGTLQVSTEPSGARVLVDGKTRAQTPAFMAVASGRHVIRLQRPGFADATFSVRAQTNAPVQIDARLWRSHPDVNQLRPTVPGTTVANAQFLSDGRVAITVAFPSGNQQIWVVDADGHNQPVGPSQPTIRAALTASGNVIATAAAASTAGYASRANQVWTANASDQSLGKKIYEVDGAADAEVTDLAWAPDGAHLRIAVASHPSSGTQTNLLWTSGDSNDTSHLVQIPGEVVAGSYSWLADAKAVAFLVRTQASVALCVLQLPVGSLHYLSDASQSTGNAIPFPPLTWSPDGGEVLYQAGQGANGIGLGWFSGKPETPLFVAKVDGSQSHRLPGPGAQFPVWRRDGSLAGFAKDDSGKPLSLVSLSPPNSGQVLAQLPLQTTSQLAARWDLQRDQALLAVTRGTGFNAPDYWWVRFATENAQ